MYHRCPNDWLVIDSNPTFITCCYPTPGSCTHPPPPIPTPASFRLFLFCTATFAFDSSRFPQPASHSHRACRLSVSLDISTDVLYSPTSPPNLLTPGKSHLDPRLKAMRLLPSCKLNQAACSSDFHFKNDGNFVFNVGLTGLLFSFRETL
jgi:hypothetical protein